MTSGTNRPNLTRSLLTKLIDLLKNVFVFVKNHPNLIRGLLILAIALFFGYRYAHLGHIVYLAFIVVFGGAGLLTLINRLPARWQSLGLNGGISLFFLDFVFAEINLGEVVQAMANANYWLLLLSMAMVGMHMIFRVMRWQWLLKPMGKVGFWPAFRAFVIGITGNFVLPARAGEFLRAYVLGRSTGLSKTGIFATQVVERIFDGLTVLLILLGVIIFGVHDEQLQLIGLVGGAFYVGVMVGLIVFMAKRHWVDFFVHKFLPPHLAERVMALLDGFSSGLAVLKNPSQLAMVTLLNMATWVFIPISFWFALLAFDFGSTVPWQAPVLMLPVMAMGLTVPAAPGGVGLVQAAIKLTLDLTYAGLPKAANFDEVVAAAGVLIHLSQFTPEIIPGIFAFMVEGLSTSEVSAGRGLAAPETTMATNSPD